MIFKLAQRISTRLVVSGAAEAEQGELIAYGLFQILSDTLQLLVLVVVSLLLKVFPAMLVFLAFYGTLRRFIGGAHAGSHGVSKETVPLPEVSQDLMVLQVLPLFCCSATVTVTVLVVPDDNFTLP